MGDAGTKRMLARRFAVVAGLVIGVALVSWRFVGHDIARSAAPPPDLAIPVTAGIAEVEDVPVYAQGIGTIQTINMVNVKSRVDGEIIRAFFTQGQEVQQNTPL